MCCFTSPSIHPPSLSSILSPNDLLLPTLNSCYPSLPLLFSWHLLLALTHPHSPPPSLLFTPFACLNTSLPSKSLLCPLPPHLTVIQDVDSSSLEANYQSFASLMEQRLAELFLVAGRQGSQTARSRRATTVGGYTVQVWGDGILQGLCSYKKNISHLSVERNPFICLLLLKWHFCAA